VPAGEHQRRERTARIAITRSRSTTSLLLLGSGHDFAVAALGVDEERQSADVVVLMVDVVAGARGRYP
jgi:hypothetical protein